MTIKSKPKSLPAHLECHPDSLGDWNGQEDLAASNMNLIYTAIYNAVGGDSEENLDSLEQGLKHASDYWGSDENLLTISDEEITRWTNENF